MRLRGGGIAGFQRWFLGQFPDAALKVHLHACLIFSGCFIQNASHFRSRALLFRGTKTALIRHLLPWTAKHLKV